MDVDPIRTLRQNIEGIGGKCGDVARGRTTSERAVADIAEVIPTLVRTLDLLEHRIPSWLVVGDDQEVIPGIEP